MNTMTQAKWDRLTQAERTAQRDNSGLTAQLVGLEGSRVEVEDDSGDIRRFQVGKSTGWRPCHLEIHNRRCRGGEPADQSYRRVTVIRRGGGS